MSNLYDKLCEGIFNAQEEMAKEKIELNSVTLNGRKFWKLIPVNDPDLKPTIFGMALNVDYTMPDSIDFVAQYVPPRPKWKVTNADRIRAMSDEELADKVMCYIRCDGCEKVFHIDCDPLKTCRGVWLDWLKSPVKDGDT